MSSNQPATKPLWFGQADATNTTHLGAVPGCESERGAGGDHASARPSSLRSNPASITSPCAASPCATRPPPGRRPRQGRSGLITAHWCKGWIIENNDDPLFPLHAAWPSANTATNGTTAPAAAEGYVGTHHARPEERLEQGDRRAATSFATTTSHHCEQAGDRRQPGLLVQHRSPATRFTTSIRSGCFDGAEHGRHQIPRGH